MLRFKCPLRVAVWRVADSMHMLSLAGSKPYGCMLSTLIEFESSPGSTGTAGTFCSEQLAGLAGRDDLLVVLLLHQLSVLLQLLSSCL